MNSVKHTVGAVVAATALVVTPFLISACDLAVGPPVQDIGYEHNVGPAMTPEPGGQKLPPDSSP